MFIPAEIPTLSQKANRYLFTYCTLEHNARKIKKWHAMCNNIAITSKLVRSELSNIMGSDAKKYFHIFEIILNHANFEETTFYVL